MNDREYREITDLLHDARLLHLEWNAALARMTLVFDCLRRNPDRSALSDPTVELALDGLCACVIGYESGIDGIRPSLFRPKQLVTAEHLHDWTFSPQEADVSVNSPGCEDDAVNAMRSERLVGDSTDLHACRFRIGITLDHTPMLGLPTNTVILLLGCDAFAISSAGLPLDLDTWREQYSAWWNHWEKHWEAKSDEGAEEEGCLEDNFIPVDASPPSELNYQHPDEPAAAWEPTDAPAELLKPITDLFAAKRDRDWLRLAKAYPNLDLSPIERADQLAKWAEQDFGRWGYARQVDGWWIEGPHAEVIVRGIEHTMPEDAEPSSNAETVWTFRLRCRSGMWTIRTWSQGWPRHGSAPGRAAAEKPWLQRWTSGSVQSDS